MKEFFEIKAFEDKFEVYHLPKSCVIGKEVCNGGSIGNTASDLWNDVFASGSIEVRMTLPHILNHSTYGWTCDYDAETDIAPADTPVPDGFVYRDIPETDEWNEQRIKERAALLADKAKQIRAYPDMTAAQLAPYQTVEKLAERYSPETYDTNVFTKTLFEVLDRRIQNLSSDVKREFKKLYVAYKLDTNFVDIVFQKQRLRISLNMKFSEVIDPNGICRDITGLGRWGNGDVELYMEHTSDVDKIMEIVEQSYRLQADE